MFGKGPAVFVLFALAPWCAMSQTGAGPMQFVVNGMSKTIHDVGLAQTCGFIDADTSEQMQVFLSMNLQHVATTMRGVSADNENAGFAALNKAFSAGLWAQNASDCTDLLNSPDRMATLGKLQLLSQSNVPP